MKAYLLTSGGIFGLIVLAHLLRVFAEGSHLLREPFFILMTIAAAALSGWAFSLLRSPAR